MTRRSSILSESNSDVNSIATIENVREGETDCTFDSELSDESTPSAPATHILRGVTAYVEVRTCNDNRSHAISAALRQLGAVVVSKFTDDVTHVIFKEGLKRTRDKAIKKNIHLVSVLWVDSCRKKDEHVSEKLFPAIVPESSSTPVQFPRFKKMKSMQPSDFNEDVVSSAERCQKRRKRVATMQRFQIMEETPEFTPPAILVQETQPRSVSPSYQASDSRWTTPVSLTIPDTPPSMREKLKQLKLAKLNGTTFSPLARPTDDTEPLIRKLFTGECQGVEEEDPLPAAPASNVPRDASLKGQRKKKLLTEPVRPSSFLMEPTHCSTVERPSLVSPALNCGVQGRKKQLTEGSQGRVSVEEAGSGHVKVDRGRSLEEPGSGPVKGEKGISLEEPGSGPVKRGRRRTMEAPGSGPSHRGRKRKVEEQSDTTDTDRQTKKKTRCNGDTYKAGTEVQRRRSVRGRVSSAATSDMCNSDTSRTDHTLSTLGESDKSRMLGASMSAIFDSTAVMTGLAAPRPSIDEFSVCKPRLGKGNANSVLSSIYENDKRRTQKPKYERKPRRGRSSLCQSSSENGDDEATETSMNDTSGVCDRPKPTQIKLRRANSFANDKSTCLPTSSLFGRNRPSIVMTSLHTHEQETIISVIKNLGGFLMQDDVCETTTHVVYGEARRTLNLLAAIARGCWLLHKEWVFKSVEAGHWLDEEPYECCSKFPQAKVARQERQSQGDEYRQALFSSCGQIFVSSKCVPPRGSLVNLLTLCGGQVTNSVSRCSVYIGPEPYTGRKSIKPVWILDCVMEQKLLPYDQYILTPTSKRESSPEF
ncbi:microcephalin-like [Haliotis asinina]|uniref:microcephalin-like n=1 Tax=Haliotis asinina TaxID=109174 RepID=UPI0035317F0E